MDGQPQQAKPRIYLRKIQPMNSGAASEDTMIWIWVGNNPVGHDWSLGSVRLFSIQETLLHYLGKLRRVGRCA
jgi:hypothetical protein